MTGDATMLQDPPTETKGVGTILLRSSWQTINIGDVAHTPGAITALLGAGAGRIILWPGSLGDREQTMLADRFGDLEFAYGDIGADGRPDTPELARAFEEADLFIHGSAAGMGSRPGLRAWRPSGKPYGFFGITFDPLGNFMPFQLPDARRVVGGIAPGHLDDEAREILDGAAFVFCRDTISLDYLRGQDVRAEILEPGPDATFAFDIRDEAGADAVLADHGLEPGYLVAVPRLRYTPYAHFRNLPITATDLTKDAVNEAFTPRDLGVLTETISWWVRTTGRQVLIAPEMSYAVALIADHWPATLPQDVRGKVAIMDEFWDLPTATATYARAAAVVSIECHSPILATTVGVPGTYLRQPTDTVKGAMYADLGGSNMVNEIDDGAAEVIERLARVVADPAAARGAAERVHAEALRQLSWMGRAAVAASRVR
ncbi:polysaccharide pyruvyl transferase family protein [Occultella aeris]|nr:polysaccharide pyruvyl transferase family protein [Occultella aeris]